MVVDGNKISKSIILELNRKKIPNKFLAVFSIVPNRATLSFIKKKEEIAKKLNIDFRVYIIEEHTNNDKLRQKMKQIILNKKCGGAILQLPTPPHINSDYVVNVIPPTKDVEAMTSRVVGDFFKNRSKILPPSVAVLEEIFGKYKINIENAEHVTIIGAGKLIGKPIASYLMNKVKELTIIEKGGSYKQLKKSDIVISGTGTPNLIKGNMLKKDSIFIDFGYARDTNSKKLVGDLDVKSLKTNYLSLYTPTPGGTGLILIAKLFKNFYTLNGEV